MLPSDDCFVDHSNPFCHDITKIYMCVYWLVKESTSSEWYQDSSAPVEKDSSAPRKFGTRTNRHRIFFQTNVISFFKIKSKKVKKKTSMVV